MKDYVIIMVIEEAFIDGVDQFRRLREREAKAHRLRFFVTAKARERVEVLGG